MPYQIPVGYGLFVTTLRNGGLPPYSIRWGLDLTNAATLAQADMNRISNIVRDQLKTEYDATWTVGETKLYFAPFAANQLLLLEDLTTEPGTASVQVYCPPAVSWIVKKRSTIVGRKHRGRMYMPGLEEQNVDEGGVVLSTKIANGDAMLVALFNALLADAAIDNMVILHALNDATTPTAITSLGVATICGTQRPRQRRS